MRVFAPIILVLCLAIAAISAWPAKDTNRANDYCDMDPKNEHTMCKYKDATGGKVVNTETGQREWEGGNGCKITYRGIDKVGQTAILKQLNMRRNAVAGGEVEGQPSASNMKKLVWSDELETIAQRWADQCNTGANVHDEHRNKLDGTAVGQNAFTGGYWRQKDADYDNANYDYKLEEDQDRQISWANGGVSYFNSETQGMIMKHLGSWTDAWYNEVKDFDKANIKPFKSNDAYGHYTQDVWAETEEVGCGLAFYLSAEQKENTDFEYYTGLLYCNFAKSGNTLGAEMYKEGTPASKCDGGYSADKDYPNLCSK